ncbi:MAG: Asp-tRNA(Asn)/Glu-tRNA(Gln) amidotransferase subunit GatB [Termitinemataceae bacterium]|nr:MAG: Asp-tRNA(Asn)/Glu-tRNA(Gln) amidotransferase subunit GatB [Termitinemataceae bacterium]
MYQSFIGLEVHIHLLTKTKVFCGCRSAFGDEPNTNICPVCLGYPGVMPALNVEAMRMAALVARSLNCTIPERTQFDRKQYFYPDMPKNYQISQFISPIGQKGCVEIEGNGIKKKVRITECHLEEDAGKMIHSGSASLLDYNRAGMSLLEIVTEPDMESGEEAELFIQQLRRMVRYLGVCDGNMEEGSLRADANVSINRVGAGLGRKVEIKNLNSSRFVKLGLNYEIKRQSLLLDEGKTIKQETRLWNENRDETSPMRSKENANDYRFFPEPDLPVFLPDAAFLKSVDDMAVELPLSRMRRFKTDLSLNDEQADLLTEERALADYFEASVKAAVESGLEKNDAAKRICNWILTDIKHFLSSQNIPTGSIGTLRLTPKRLAQIVVLLAQGKISNKSAKQTFLAVFAEDKDPKDIVSANGWEQVSDPAIIEEFVKTVFAQEDDTVSDLKAAISAANAKKIKTLTAFLVGKVIASSGGRASPEVVSAQIARILV